MPVHSPGQRLSVVMACSALLAGLQASSAQAFALGPIRVQSALGEPLRAELLITQLSPDESDTLMLRQAPATVYLHSGYTQHAALHDLTLTVASQQGTQVTVNLRSRTAVDEPYVDLVLIAGNDSAQLRRDYTLLFDPPTQPRPIDRPSPAETLPPLSSTRAEARGDPRSKPGAAALQPGAAYASEAGDTRRLRIQRGDTAFGFARRHRPPGASIDQMLMALLALNPKAFVQSNVNRMRAGAELRLPEPDQVLQRSPTADARAVAAQYADFALYVAARRQALAARAPGIAPQHTAADTMAGVISGASNSDPTPADAATDRLTLEPIRSPPAATAGATPAPQSMPANGPDNTRNTVEPTPAPAPAPIGTAAAPSPANAPAADTDASDPTAATVAVASATSTAAEPAAAQPARPAPSPRGIWHHLQGELVGLPGAVALLALLVAALSYVRRQRQVKIASETDDSLFAASGSLDLLPEPAPQPPRPASVPTPAMPPDAQASPLVAAEVYLAYGRDTDAERALSEALGQHPQDLPLRQKLMELYAKHRQSQAFGMQAMVLWQQTQGQGPVWEAMQELGRDIDTANPLYGALAATPATGPIEAESAASPAPAETAEVPTLDMTALTLEPPVSGEPPLVAAPAAAAAPARTSAQVVAPTAAAPLPSDSDASRQLALAEGLRRLGDTARAHSLVLPLCSDVSPKIRDQAHALLATIGDEPAAGPRSR